MRIPALLALLAIAGCSGDSGPSQDAEKKWETRDTLVIAVQEDMDNLIPVVSQSAADSYIEGAIYFPTIDSEFDCSLKKIPALATEWNWSDDGTVISLTLRDDISWEDGTKVTANDILFGYDLVRDPAVASPRISYVQHAIEGKFPLVVDDTHLEFHFTHAYDRDTQAAHISAIPALPKHLLGEADRASLRKHAFGKSPMSAGPFRLAAHEPGQRIVLEPNWNFTGPEEYRPKLNRVILRVIPEYATRLIELEKGTIDLMQSVQFEDVDRLAKEHPNLRLVRRGWRSMDYVAWNQQNDLFKDVKVRRALTMAMDVDHMMSQLLTSDSGEVYGRRSVGTITPALCGVHNDDIQPLPHNLEQAKALLAEAGWTDTNGNGVVDKDGQELSFTLTTNNGNPRRAKAAVFIQDYLKQAGVEVKIETLAANTFFENLRKKDYQAALSGWSAGLFVDPSTIWHSDVTKGVDPQAVNHETPNCSDTVTDNCVERRYEFNFVSYNSAKADELIEQGLRTPVPSESAPIWQELQQVIYEDQPYTFLWWMDEVIAVDSRFENTSIDVLAPFGNLHDWSVPADKVKYER
ncbi:MAG: hypothetical protein EP330_12210 [Deltaproteobacteria bacterium]|nr:MAG: hypothetical protein EP330_12210 [Deltaproteobacteria bacterium]